MSLFHKARGREVTRRLEPRILRCAEVLWETGWFSVWSNRVNRGHGDSLAENSAKKNMR